MSEPTPNKGIHIIDGEIHATGDMVGGDKSVTNIILVGQLLDLVRVQQLIPDFPTDQLLGKTKSEIEAKLADSFAGGGVEAAAFAGEVLGVVIASTPRPTNGPLQFREILEKLPELIFRVLTEKGYWKNIYQYVSVPTNSKDVRMGGQVFWLRSSKKLRAQASSSDNMWGIAEVYITKLGTSYDLVEEKEDHFHRLSSSDFTSEEFRLFIVALTIDLIRLSSTAAGDLAFWDAFIDYTQAKQAREEQT